MRKISQITKKEEFGKTSKGKLEQSQDSVSEKKQQETTTGKRGAQMKTLTQLFGGANPN